jgi:tetratricopeptide (TPR) repeat protein
LSCFNQAILIAPNVLINYINKGASLSLLGRHKEAIVVYDFILSLSPNHRIASTNKAIDLTALKKFDEAVCIFYQILGDHPEDVNCLNYLASIYIELGLRENALAINQEILNIDPVNGDAIARKDSN